nr:hypothetical protein Iba_scaffold686CG0070 [Ipomoea batatas]
MVPETPMEGLPPQSAHGSDMQIENAQDAPIAGDQTETVVEPQDVPSDPPAAVRPRSYRDSVVGHGSEAAPFLGLPSNIRSLWSSFPAHRTARDGGALVRRLGDDWRTIVDFEINRSY